MTMGKLSLFGTFGTYWCCADFEIEANVAGIPSPNTYERWHRGRSLRCAGRHRNRRGRSFRTAKTFGPLCKVPAGRKFAYFIYGGKTDTTDNCTLSPGTKRAGKKTSCFHVLGGTEGVAQMGLHPRRPPGNGVGFLGSCKTAEHTAGNLSGSPSGVWHQSKGLTKTSESYGIGELEY
jgi:hypothetical protein